MHTAEQKIRDRLADNAWRFQHEGTHVVRRLTGGIRPDAYVTLEQQGSEMVAHCPHCNEEMGRYDASYGTRTGAQVAAIRDTAYRHHKEQHPNEISPLS